MCAGTITNINIIRIVFPVAIVALGIIFYYVDPMVFVPTPKCVFKMLTGLQCPSCGIQRAIHALVKGDIIGALSYNWFLVFSLPYALAAVLSIWYNFGHRLDFLRRLVISRATVRTYICLFFAWWIIRNILHI